MEQRNKFQKGIQYSVNNLMQTPQHNNLTGQHQPFQHNQNKLSFHQQMMKNVNQNRGRQYQFPNRPMQQQQQYIQGGQQQQQSQILKSNQKFLQKPHQPNQRSSTAHNPVHQMQIQMQNPQIPPSQSQTQIWQKHQYPPQPPQQQPGRQHFKGNRMNQQQSVSLPNQQNNQNKQNKQKVQQIQQVQPRFANNTVNMNRSSYEQQQYQQQQQQQLGQNQFLQKNRPMTGGQIKPQSTISKLQRTGDFQGQSNQKLFQQQRHQTHDGTVQRNQNQPLLSANNNNNNLFDQNAINFKKIKRQPTGGNYRKNKTNNQNQQESQLQQPQQSNKHHYQNLQQQQQNQQAEGWMQYGQMKPRQTQSYLQNGHSMSQSPANLKNKPVKRPQNEQNKPLPVKKRVVCPFFKRGTCIFKDKCKNSHDLKIEQTLSNQNQNVTNSVQNVTNSVQYIPNSFCLIPQNYQQTDLNEQWAMDVEEPEMNVVEQTNIPNIIQIQDKKQQFSQNKVIIEKQQSQQQKPFSMQSQLQLQEKTLISMNVQADKKIFDYKDSLLMTLGNIKESANQQMSPSLMDSISTEKLKAYQQAFEKKHNKNRIQGQKEYEFSNDLPMEKEKAFNKACKNSENSCFEYKKLPKDSESQIPVQEKLWNIHMFTRSEASKIFKTRIGIDKIVEIWDFICTQILDVDNALYDPFFKRKKNKTDRQHTFNCINSYLQNRTRMLKVNLSRQPNLICPKSIRVLEEIIRFQIISLHSNKSDIINKSKSIHYYQSESKENLKMITDLLGNLLIRYNACRTYAKSYFTLFFNKKACPNIDILQQQDPYFLLSHQTKNETQQYYISPNESEFIAYHICFMYGKMDQLSNVISKLHQRQYKSVLFSNNMNRAICAWGSLTEEQPQRYISLLQEADYTMACAMAHNLPEMRVQAMKKFIQVHKQSASAAVKLDDLNSHLCFDTEQHMLDFLSAYGVKGIDQLQSQLLDQPSSSSSQFQDSIEGKQFCSSSIHPKETFQDEYNNSSHVPEDFNLVTCKAKKVNFVVSQQYQPAEDVNDKYDTAFLKRRFFVQNRALSEDKQRQISNASLNDLFEECFPKKKISFQKIQEEIQFQQSLQQQQQKKQFQATTQQVIHLIQQSDQPQSPKYVDIINIGNQIKQRKENEIQIELQQQQLQLKTSEQESLQKALQDKLQREIEQKEQERIEEEAWAEPKEPEDQESTNHKLGFDTADVRKCVQFRILMSLYKRSMEHKKRQEYDLAKSQSQRFEGLEKPSNINNPIFGIETGNANKIQKYRDLYFDKFPFFLLTRLHKIQQGQLQLQPYQLRYNMAVLASFNRKQLNSFHSQFFLHSLCDFLRGPLSIHPQINDMLFEPSLHWQSLPMLNHYNVSNSTSAQDLLLNIKYQLCEAVEDRDLKQAQCEGDALQLQLNASHLSKSLFANVDPVNLYGLDTIVFQCSAPNYMFEKLRFKAFCIYLQNLREQQFPSSTLPLNDKRNLQNKKYFHLINVVLVLVSELLSNNVQNTFQKNRFLAKVQKYAEKAQQLDLIGTFRAMEIVSETQSLIIDTDVTMQLFMNLKACIQQREKYSDTKLCVLQLEHLFDDCYNLLLNFAQRKFSRHSSSSIQQFFYYKHIFENICRQVAYKIKSAFNSKNKVTFSFSQSKHLQEALHGLTAQNYKLLAKTFKYIGQFIKDEFYAQQYLKMIKEQCCCTQYDVKILSQALFAYMKKVLFSIGKKEQIQISESYLLQKINNLCQETISQFQQDNRLGLLGDWAGFFAGVFRLCSTLFSQHDYLFIAPDYLQQIGTTIQQQLQTEDWLKDCSKYIQQINKILMINDSIDNAANLTIKATNQNPSQNMNINSKCKRKMKTEQKYAMLQQLNQKIMETQMRTLDQKFSESNINEPFSYLNQFQYQQYFQILKIKHGIDVEEELVLF